jgi:hypothetical protein
MDIMEQNKNKPERISHFFITINSNKVPQDQNHYRKLVECFDRFVFDYFNYKNREYVWNKYSRYDFKRNLAKLFYFLDDDGSIDDVNKIRLNYVVELGKNTRGGRVHLHMHLRVYHTTKLRIDIPELKNAAAQYLSPCGITSPYVHVKGFSDRARNLEIYMEKEAESRGTSIIYER